MAFPLLEEIEIYSNLGIAVPTYCVLFTIGCNMLIWWTNGYGGISR